MNPRVVIDTNGWVSALIRPNGAAGALLFRLFERRYLPIYSAAMLSELTATLARPKLRIKYGVDADAIRALLDALHFAGELVVPTRRVRICRDPYDDMFVEAAIAGRATAIVTGDLDLLSLATFEDVEMQTLQAFLASL